MTVLSGSMRPAFSPGDLTIVTPGPAERVRVGDVIAFNIPVGDHRVESHRVTPWLREPPLRWPLVLLAPAAVAAILIRRIWLEPDLDPEHGARVPA